MTETQTARFNAAWNRVNAVYESFARRQGSSFSGMLVFAHIAQAEGCTQKEICERALLNKQTANSIVKALRDRGLVELKPLKSDRRSKGIFLTEEGLRFAEKTVGRIAEAERIAMSSLPPELREALTEGLLAYGSAFRETLLGEV